IAASLACTASTRPSRRPNPHPRAATTSANARRSTVVFTISVPLVSATGTSPAFMQAGYSAAVTARSLILVKLDHVLGQEVAPEPPDSRSSAALLAPDLVGLDAGRRVAQQRGVGGALLDVGLDLDDRDAATGAQMAVELLCVPLQRPAVEVRHDVALGAGGMRALLGRRREVPRTRLARLRSAPRIGTEGRHALAPCRDGAGRHRRCNYLHLWERQIRCPDVVHGLLQFVDAGEEAERVPYLLAFVVRVVIAHASFPQSALGGSIAPMRASHFDLGQMLW